MITQTKLRFIKDKIAELEDALFFTDSKAVLKLPTLMIRVIHVDDAGQVWFLIPSPTQNKNEFDREIPAKLEFYKKGKDFYLHLWGKASIITDPEEIYHIDGISSEVKKLAMNDKTLVKITISEQFHYVHPKHETSAGELRKISYSLSGFVKTLQYVVKNIIPVFQSH